jgi:hypothetical protein
MVAKDTMVDRVLRDLQHGGAIKVVLRETVHHGLGDERRTQRAGFDLEAVE